MPDTLKSTVPKQYEVTITYKYLTKATSAQEAIGLAMDRVLGRRFGQVYFDGMITRAEITERTPPAFGDIGIHEAERSIEEFKEFEEFEVTKGESHYGVDIKRDRKDTKVQDYIHIYPADQV